VYLILQDLFNKFSNVVAELKSQTVDLGSDILLSTKVVTPVLKTDFVSLSHTPDDDIPLRILKKNIKIVKGVL